MATRSGKDEDPEQFFAQVNALLDEAESYLAKAGPGELAEPAAGCIAAIREELDEALQLVGDDVEARVQMGLALGLASTNPLLALALSQMSGGLDDVNWGKLLSTALDWVVTLLKKADQFLTDGKLKTLFKDLTILIPQLKTLIDTGPDKVDELTLDVAELEAKVERFLHQVLGKPLVKVPGKKGAEVIPPVDGAVEEPELTGSVLWFLWDIERKLEHLWERVEGGSFPRPGPGEIISPPSSGGQPIGKEVDEIIQRLDCLTKFLGRTLYNVEWDCSGSLAPPPAAPPEGELHPEHQDGLRHPRAVPPVSIKDEIHNLERLIWYLITIFRPPPPPEPPEEPPWPPIPPEDPPEDPVILADLKRILVYEEGVFSPLPGADEKVIAVRSAAFDLAGWIDLTDLADGQRVAVEMHVLLPGGVRRLYRSRSFSGSAEAGLYALQEVVGPIIVVGNAVDIVLRREAGGAIDIAYQFVVETQRLRA